MSKKLKIEKRHYLSETYEEVYNFSKLVYIAENYESLDLKPLRMIQEKSILATVQQLKLSMRSMEMKDFPHFVMEQRYYRNDNLLIGRIYPEKLGYCNMSKILRHTLSDNLYWDLDIINCHPTILLHLCKTLEIDVDYSFLEEYVNNRDQALEDLIAINQKYEVSKDEAKTWFLKIFNGGDGADYFLEYTPLMNHIRSNYHVVQMFLKEKLVQLDRYLPLMEYVTNISKENINTRFISFILFDVENQIREVIEKWCGLNNFLWKVNCFDGGMILKEEGKSLEDKILLIEEFIKNELQISVFLKCKDMTEYKLNIPEDILVKYSYEYCVAQFGNDSEKYALRKCHFELNNFFVSSEVKYYFENEISTWSYSRTDFANKYEHEFILGKDKKGNDVSVSFIKQWLQDPKKRTYFLTGLFPPGVNLPINPIDASDVNYAYSLWKDWRVVHIPRLISDVSSQVLLLRSHTQYLWNENTEFINYVEKYIAYILRNPGVKTGVCIALKAIHGGEGKNTWFDIHSKLFGDNLCVAVQNHDRDWFGAFNEVIHEKIWIHMEEISKDLIRKNIKQFLSYITSTSETINFKGGQKRVKPSYSNYFLTFNTQGIEGLPGVQRRLFIHEFERSKPKRDHEYFQELYRRMNNDQVIRGYYDYLMSLDISKYKPTEFPQTSYMVKMFGIADDSAIKNLTKTESFIVDQVTQWYSDCGINEMKIAGNVLYQEMEKTISKSYMPRQINMYSEIAIFLGLGVHRYMKQGSAWFTFYLDECIEILSQKGIKYRKDFNNTEIYEDCIIETKIPCLKRCSDRNKAGTYSAKFDSAMGAYTIWKNCQKLKHDSFEHKCPCGGHYLLTKNGNC